MAIQCIGGAVVSAEPAFCFARTADLERWPDWARDLGSVQILDWDSEGRPHQVRMVAELFGKEFDATVDFDYEKAPDTLAFNLVEARKLRRLDGVFRFEPERGGTLMSFEVLITLVKPKAARLERMMGRRIETALGRDLRRHLERAG